jgi:hypothetical protein
MSDMLLKEFNQLWAALGTGSSRDLNTVLEQRELRDTTDTELFRQDLNLLRLPISPPSRGADGGTPTHTPFGRGF